MTTMGMLAAVVFVAAIAARQAHGRPGGHVQPVGSIIGTGNCHYQLDVKTEDVFLAGTDSDIFFDLYSKDNAVISTNSMPEAWDYRAIPDFEQGTTTTLSYDDWCLRPCRINITLDHQGDSFASWKCESVRVIVSGDLKDDVTFDVRKWLGPDGGQTVTVDKCGGKLAT